MRTMNATPRHRPRTAEEIVAFYRERGDPDTRIRALANSRDEPMRSEILALLAETLSRQPSDTRKTTSNDICACEAKEIMAERICLAKHAIKGLIDNLSAVSAGCIDMNVYLAHPDPTRSALLVLHKALRAAKTSLMSLDPEKLIDGLIEREEWASGIRRHEDE